jgi:hypothetical protein
MLSFIIQGGAPGADFLAKMWAMDNDVPCVEYHINAEDAKYGPGMSGVMRNARMLRESFPTLVVAFPGGNGTANMVDLAKKAGVLTLEIAA